MDYFKLSKLNLSAIVIAIALGVAAALLVYLAQARGLVPGISGQLSKPSVTEIRTVVQEESAVISAVEKAGQSIVAIGPENGIGFIIDSKGLIVTNKHMVSSSGPYTIVTKDGQKYETKKIYKDPNLDLSLIQIDATGLRALELGDSSKLKLGQNVIVVGQKGQAVNVSVGVISGLSSSIQTDALIGPENSGGPLLSSAGQVVGVNVAGAGQASGSAIPSNVIKQFIDESIDTAKPYMGIRYKFISNPQGALVQEVISNGPAEAGGVKSGDIISDINGQVIDTDNKVIDIIAKSKIGQRVELTVMRSGKELKLTVTSIKAPDQ